MAEWASHITIVGPESRADLVLPANVPLAELLPDIAKILGVAIGPDQVIPNPRLYTPLGPGLNPDRSLAEQGIRDGALLMLRDASEAPPPPVVEDLVEMVATVLDERRDRWTGESARQLARVLSGVWVVAAGLSLLIEREFSRRALLAALMIVLVTGAAAAVRTLKQPVLATVLVVASLPAFAVAGESLTAVALGVEGPGAVAIGVALGAAVGGLTGLVVAPASRVPSLAITVLAVPLAGMLVVGRWLGADLVREAAVLAIVWLLMADLSPRIALRLSGLKELPQRPPTPLVAERVGAGHLLLTGLLGAEALGLSAAMAVLALSSDGAAQLLCATLALALALRMHRFQLKSQVYPLALATMAGVLTLEGALATRLAGLSWAGPPAAVTLILLSVTVPLVVAVMPARPQASSPSWRRGLRVAAIVVDLTLLPLLALVLGLFSGALQTGARLV